MGEVEAIQWSGGPVRQLVAIAAAATGVAEEIFYGDARSADIVRHRQCVMFAAVQLGVSTTSAGRVLGNRDHSTIIHGKRRVEQRLAAGDKDTAELVGVLLANSKPLDVARTEAIGALREMLAELVGQIAADEDTLAEREPELMERLNGACRRAESLRWTLKALGEGEKDPLVPEGNLIEVPPLPEEEREGPFDGITRWKCPNCERQWLAQRVCVCG